MKKTLIVFILFGLSLFGTDKIVKIQHNLGMHTICVDGYLYFRTNDKNGTIVPTKKVLFPSESNEEVPIKCPENISN